MQTSFQDCISNISFPSEDAVLRSLLYLSADTLKDSRFHHVGNLGNLTNKSHPKVVSGIMRFRDGRIAVWFFVIFMTCMSEGRDRNVWCFVIFLICVIDRIQLESNLLVYSTYFNPVEFQSKLVDWNTGLCEFEPPFFGFLVRLEFRFMWIRAAVFFTFGGFSTTGIPVYVGSSSRFLNFSTTLST